MALISEGSADRENARHARHRILAVIESQARHGERALCNEDLAELVGSNERTLVRHLERLVETGRLRIEFAAGVRRFYVTSLDRWTAWSVRLRRATRRTALRKRSCMSCRETFASEGAHNRLCASCRTRGGDPVFTIGGGIPARSARPGAA